MTDVFQPLATLVRGQRQYWRGLHGAAFGLSLAAAAKRHQGNVLIVTEDALTARQLQEEIQFFSGGEIPVLNFPSWETLPYDNFSPHQQIVSERMLALAKLQSGERCVVILPVSS